MATIQDLEIEIQRIKDRNIKVEADKAWETSWIRKVIISILTYLVISIFFLFAKISNPFINAIVPALAFLLSTASLSFFKNLWTRYYKK
ncbi:hypothetical protein A3I48_03595 [Candidatus Daviesbacteria bacterium RIFCSPLOWO2_02_FULL_36_7]|uniref:Uncharacterized protein n=1 Tax=Candidatus Daviesbacteria bacterium RIFCSPLOWO2_02_FULL_36_7 TaxID=1797792 RepID=A0A1F5MGM4_9BACT|nr:MAG: hypothetical protein A3I48_03595 [Candidatus Daviesbacteria bacterium RIFCSPLOWO2_02_FULL_36_7]